MAGKVYTKIVKLLSFYPLSEIMNIKNIACLYFNFTLKGHWIPEEDQQNKNPFQNLLEFEDKSTQVTQENHFSVFLGFRFFDSMEIEFGCI